MRDSEGLDYWYLHIGVGPQLLEDGFDGLISTVEELVGVGHIVDVDPDDGVDGRFAPQIKDLRSSSQRYLL